jgi:hypothetical protein
MDLHLDGALLSLSEVVRLVPIRNALKIMREVTDIVALSNLMLTESGKQRQLQLHS